MGLDALQLKVVNAVDAAAGEILSASRSIHGRPELGRAEVFASGLLERILEEAGFSVERGYGGIPTAFRARAGSIAAGTGGKRGRRVAFLAEYDALPEIGHGCGHNIISCSALGAGLGLAAAAADLGGEVVVVGTPSEETDGAKVEMAAKGCFDDVDAALMIHPYDGNYWITESLAMDAIEIEFFGKPAHAAASPWEGQNALDAVILAFNNVSALRQQVKPDARIHGIIVEGGKAPNVIPDHTRARFYVRAKRRDYLDALVGKFKDCAKAAALATGTRVEMRNYEASFDDMASNAALSERFRDHMVADLGSGPFKRAPESFGSIDMGNVSHVVPGIHALVDIVGEGSGMSLHTPEFRDAAASPLGEESLIRAAKGLALTGLDVLRDSSLLAKARGEFETALGYKPKGSGD